MSRLRRTVRFRMAPAHPGRVAAIIMRNGNAYVRRSMAAFERPYSASLVRILISPMSVLCTGHLSAISSRRWRWLSSSAPESSTIRVISSYDTISGTVRNGRIKEQLKK
jgi:hypothetical protein